MNEIRIGSHALQPGRQLLVNGEHVHLGARALQILSVLAEANGEIVTKDELFEAVWPDQVVEENALQAHMSAIRKALGEDADRLTTLRGVGYQLVVGEVASSDVLPAGSSKATTEAKLSAPKTEGRSRWRMGILVVIAATLLASFSLALLRNREAGSADETAEVTVYPFTASSALAQDITLAAGITDELIIRLRRIPELRVVTGDPDESQAENSISGSVRTDGNRLRVSARLEDVGGAVIWSDNFDGELHDLLGVQEQIAAAVADTLSVSLDVGVLSSAHGGTDSPEAFALFLQAGEAALDPQAVTLLERAVSLDPDFTRANTNLVISYGYRLWSTTNPGEAKDLLEKMDQASARALEATPDLAFAHVARAWYYLANNNLVEADRSMIRAEALDPNNDIRLKVHMSGFATQFGRYEKRDRLVEQMMLIEPTRDNAGPVVVFLVNERQFEEALDLFESAGAEGGTLNPLDYSAAYWAYMLTGDPEAALSVPIPEDSDFLSFEIHRQYRPGWHDAELFPNLPFDELNRWANDRYGVGGAFDLAYLALFAGYAEEHQLAVDYMRLAAERPNVSGYFFFWHPALRETRRTSLFEEFVTDIGLVQAWRESDEWGDFCRPVSETEIACE